MSGPEIQETLGNIQKSNDKVARGISGLIANAALLTIAKMVYDCDDPGCDERKQKLLGWMDKNTWANKYINNLVPFYLTAYIAWEHQKEKGVDKITKKYSPVRSYAYNFFNQREDSKLETAVAGIGKTLGQDSDKQEEGFGNLGELFGQLFNVDPLPYKPFKDAYTLIHGIKGDLKGGYKKPTSIPEGYLKQGLFDWPKLETADY